MTTITINGKQLPFRLSYRTLKSSLRECGLTIQTMGELDLDHIAKFAVESINGGYKFEKSTKAIDLAELEDLLDEDFSGIESISTAISSEMENIFPQGEGVEDGKK